MHLFFTTFQTSERVCPITGYTGISNFWNDFKEEGDVLNPWNSGVSQHFQVTTKNHTKSMVFHSIKSWHFDDFFEFQDVSKAYKVSCFQPPRYYGINLGDFRSGISSLWFIFYYIPFHIMVIYEKT